MKSLIAEKQRNGKAKARQVARCPKPYSAPPPSDLFIGLETSEEGIIPMHLPIGERQDMGRTVILFGERLELGAKYLKQSLGGSQEIFFPTPLCCF